MNDGLKDQQRSAILGVLNKHPKIERAVLFGSRSMGTFTPTSDIDIALYGDLTLRDQAKIADDLEQLSIPYTVDLVRMKTVSSPQLLAHIKEHGNEWRLNRRRGKGGWKRVTVAEVCELIVDCVNKTAPVVDELTPYKMLRTTNIKGGRIDLGECRRVTKETFVKWTRRADVRRGDVILTREAPLGEVGYVDFDDTVFLGQRLMQYRANPALLEPRFLLYSFLSKDLQNQFGAHEGSGSTVSHICVGDCSKFQLSLPPLAEQKAIATVLGALDDKIELNRRMNATLEAMARALFQSWFVDFDPVRAKLDGRPPTALDPATAALFPSHFEHKAEGVVPTGWRATTLGEVIEISDSKRIPLSGREREARQGKYPYHGAASVMDYVDDYLFDGIYALMGEDGSVVNDDGTPVLQYVWGKFWVNNHAHVLRGKNGISTEHLLLHLKGCNIAPFVNGAVQLKLNQANMNRIPFMLPPPEIGQAFAKTIDPLFAQIRANTDQSRTLATLRDTLLPKLLSGELQPKL